MDPELGISVPVNPNDTVNGTMFDAQGMEVLIYVLPVMMILYSLVCVVGLCGNTLVIYVVIRFSKMQTVTNLYILNLALADECFLIGLPFLISTMALQYWPFGSTMCKLYMTGTSINQFTSSLFLTIMSADRYIAVCHPISSSKYRTPFVAKLVCLTAWTASALVMVPIFMYSNTIPTPGTNLTHCNIIWPEIAHLNSQNAFTLYSFVLGFAIPLILIFEFYTLVILRLRRVGPRNKSKEKKRSHRKVTRLVLTVIAVYVGCWLPYWVSQVMLILTPPKETHHMLIILLHLITGCLAYSNSAVNPILYAFLSENFKKSFMRACTCAAGREFNMQLCVENSVGPRRTGTTHTGGHFEKKKRADSDDENELEPSTAVTQTSRSNYGVTGGGCDAKDNALATFKNGLPQTPDRKATEQL